MLLVFCTYFCTVCVLHPQTKSKMRYKKINFALVYNRKKQLNKDGKALIQIKAYQNGKSRIFSTGIFIEPKYWDARNKRVKPSHPHQRVINKQIYDQIQQMEAYETLIINRRGFLPLKRLHQYKNPATHYRNFTDFYKSELELSTIQPDSLKSQKTTYNKLKAFCDPVYFEDLTFDFLTRFDNFLHRQNLGKNTIQKHHSVVKKYIGLAIKKKYMKVDENPYLVFNAKGAPVERDFLNSLELSKLENHQFYPEHKKTLDPVRDFLLLVCYTGIRYSDAVSITPANIEKTEQGLVLKFTAQKTHKPARLPLYLLFKAEGETLSKPEQLIYKMMERHTKRYPIPSLAIKKPFFKYTNQYINRKIKLAARFCGITHKKITTHIGRRTFCSTLAAKGVAESVIMELVQHSTVTMTQIYIKMSNKMVEDALNKIDW